MSRELLPRVVLCFFTIFLYTCCKARGHVSNDCLDPDLAELEDYLSTIRFENVPTIDAMTGGFECPVSALPFGALKSDWARLILLQKAQPPDSVLRKKLLRLFRILVIAHFQTEERLHATKFDSSSSANTWSSEDGTKEKTKKLGNFATDSTGTTKIPGSHVSRIYPPSEEHVDTPQIEETTFATLDASTENGNSDRIRGDVSSFVPSSSLEIDLEERKPVDPIPTASINAIETQRYTETFNNYASVFDVATAKMNEHDEAKVDREINNGGASVRHEVTASIDDFGGSESSSFIKDVTSTLGSTASSFISDESATNYFIEHTLNEGGDKVATTDNKTEYNRISTLDSTTSSFISNEFTKNDFIEHKLNGSGDKVATTGDTDNKTKLDTTSILGSTMSSFTSDESSTKYFIQQNLNGGGDTVVTTGDVDNKTIIDTTSILGSTTSSVTSNESTTNDSIENTLNKGGDKDATTDDKTEYNRILTLDSTASSFTSNESTTKDFIQQNLNEGGDKVVATGAIDNTTEFDTTSMLSSTTGSFLSNESTKNDFIVHTLNKSGDKVATTDDIDDKTELGTTSTLDGTTSSLTSNESTTRDDTSNDIANKIELVETSTLKPSSLTDPIIATSFPPAEATETFPDHRSSLSAKPVQIVGSTESIILDATIPETAIKTDIKKTDDEDVATKVPIFANFEYEGASTASGSTEEDFRKTKGNDSPIFYGPASFEESSLGKETKSKFATVQYHNSAGSNFAESANISSQDVPGVERGGTGGEKISDNEVPASGGRFHQNRMNYGGNDIFEIFKHNATGWKSTLPRNKIRKPPISRRLPPENEFWRYIVGSRMATVPVPTTPAFDPTEGLNGFKRGAARSKKRGSLNTSVEKSFRWFYNYGQQDDSEGKAKPRGTNIECSGRNHGDAK